MERNRHGCSWYGRDGETLTRLKDLLRQKFSIVQITVLAEQPSKGRTIIEKFERYARNVDIVFVLATPDDYGGLKTRPGRSLPRARQNVVFELGFFLGSLKRSSGRVILLHKGGIELPSDMAGVVYIDVGNGLEGAEDEIRREISGWIE